MYTSSNQDKMNVQKPETKFDNVEKPQHYNSGRFETIEMIEDITKGYEDGFIAYNIGNVVKYITRAPFKKSLLEDIKKSRAYIDFVIDYIERSEKENS